MSLNAPLEDVPETGYDDYTGTITPAFSADELNIISALSDARPLFRAQKQTLQDTEYNLAMQADAAAPQSASGIIAAGNGPVRGGSLGADAGSPYGGFAAAASIIVPIVGAAAQLIEGAITRSEERRKQSNRTRTKAARDFNTGIKSGLATVTEEIARRRALEPESPQEPDAPADGPDAPTIDTPDVPAPSDPNGPDRGKYGSGTRNYEGRGPISEAISQKLAALIQARLPALEQYEKDIRASSTGRTFWSRLLRTVRAELVSITRAIGARITPAAVSTIIDAALGRVMPRGFLRQVTGKGRRVCGAKGAGSVKLGTSHGKAAAKISAYLTNKIISEPSQRRTFYDRARKHIASVEGGFPSGAGLGDIIDMGVQGVDTYLPGVVDHFKGKWGIGNEWTPLIEAGEDLANRGAKWLGNKAKEELASKGIRASVRRTMSAKVKADLARARTAAKARRDAGLDPPSAAGRPRSASKKRATKAKAPARSFKISLV
jgi:hypothetical protein